MKFDYRNLEFALGAASARGFPPDSGVEVAFAGRSNAGKSTCINTLAQRRGLARTSKTPGRTQEINFFQLDESRRIVDLPGYGFAQAPERSRKQWNQLVGDYLNQRDSLAGIVILVDIRHPMKPKDTELLDWCVSAKLPIQLLLNKADKLSRGPAKQSLAKIRGQVTALGGDIQVQLFSGLKKDGLQTLWDRLDDWLGSTQHDHDQDHE
jgi:GTP-binding protein